MKKIRKFNHPTPGLSDYLNQEDDKADWAGFRNHDAGAAYRELIETLVDIQHGICGYCEIDLTELDRQIEHVIPRGDPKEGARRELQPANLIACCKGGTRAHEVNVERRLDPIKKNCSCGQAKANFVNSNFIDPRTLPIKPAVIRVKRNGEIVADEDACLKTGFPIEKVKGTIEILGLNVERLRSARERHWSALSDGLKECRTIEEIHDRAMVILLPQDNKLTKFFSTNRSIFPMSEQILEENVDDWV